MILNTTQCNLFEVRGILECDFCSMEERCCGLVFSHRLTSPNLSVTYSVVPFLGLAIQSATKATRSARRPLFELRFNPIWQVELCGREGIHCFHAIRCMRFSVDPFFRFRGIENCVRMVVYSGSSHLPLLNWRFSEIQRFHVFNKLAAQFCGNSNERLACREGRFRSVSIGFVAVWWDIRAFLQLQNGDLH